MARRWFECFQVGVATCHVRSDAQAPQTSGRVLQPVREPACLVRNEMASGAAGDERPRRGLFGGVKGLGGSSWIRRPVHQRLLHPARLGHRRRTGHLFTDEGQDIRCLDPWDGAKASVPTIQLQPVTWTLLTVLAADMSRRKLGSATETPAKINLRLDPRFKTCCLNVCLNGGPELQAQVAADVKESFSYFHGYTKEKSEGQGTATPSPSLSGGGGGAAGGGVGEGGGGDSTPAGAEAPAAPVPERSRREKIRRAKSAKIARTETASSAVRETREDAALREYGEYMKEVALIDDDPAFTALEYWQPRAVDGLDKSGNVVVPARWPHVGLVARLYLGVDATSCQAERNFSALRLIVSDLRSKSSPGKVEKTVFVRLNKHLIPGLGKVLEDLDALKDERIPSREAAVNAKDAAAGLANVSPISIS